MRVPGDFVVFPSWKSTRSGESIGLFWGGRLRQIKGVGNWKSYLKLAFCGKTNAIHLQFGIVHVYTTSSGDIGYGLCIGFST